MFCPLCGKEIDESSDVCSGCGASLAAFRDIGTQTADMSKDLSDEDVSTLMAGGALEFVNSGEETAELNPPENLTDAAMLDLPENLELAQYGDEEIKPEKTAENTADDEIIPIVIKEKNPHILLKKILKYALVVVLSACIGFAACLAVFELQRFLPSQQTAQRSADAVRAMFDDKAEMLVYEVYTREKATENETILYVAVKENDVLSGYYYRVVISSDSEKKLNIYERFNEKRYNELKNSADPKDKIRASVMKNYGDEFEKALKGILDGTGGWTQASASFINEDFRKAQQAEAERIKKEEEQSEQTTEQTKETENTTDA